jgi:hypothetical protein
MIWCSSLFPDANEYCKWCDIFQRIGKPCRIDEIHIFFITSLELFDKRAIDFVGPISCHAH